MIALGSTGRASAVLASAGATLGLNAAAAAVAEKPSTDRERPFFGDYVKALPMRRPDAVGGVRDYRTDGRQLTGFALLAWPAQYGVTGIRSLLLNQLGDVYARDLGSKTDRIARHTSAFNPDRNWKKIATVYEDR